MTNIIIMVTILIGSYLLGSIPFGLIMGKLNGIDIREHGSKNIGSTNAIRVLGKPKGLTAFIFEVLKGAAPIILVKILEANGLFTSPLSFDGTTIYILYGAPAIIGHVLPIYLKFKGGKAIAVSLGVVLSVTPIPGVLCLVAFALLLGTTGYSSLGSTAATFTVVISTWILYFDNSFGHQKDTVTAILYSILACLLIFKHRTNYKRLLNGTESSFKKKKETKQENKEEVSE
ncbi:MAG: glycerol-3-phosphate 1-O-acyltransferase PlsY [bacterium]